MRITLNISRYILYLNIRIYYLYIDFFSLFNITILMLFLFLIIYEALVKKNLYHYYLLIIPNYTLWE